MADTREERHVVEEKRYGNTVLYSLNVESELVNHLGMIIDAQEEWEEKAVEA